MKFKKSYKTPVTKLDYLGGRFLAAFAVNALLVLSLSLGVLLSFYLPGLAQDGSVPFSPWAYVSVYFLIALPNYLFSFLLLSSTAVFQ